MLNVADLSHWQGNDLSKYPAEAYIFKATEGTSYVDPTCDTKYQQAKAQGKPVGVYHFMDGTNWKAQANHFVQSVQGYIGEAILILDYEAYGKQGANIAKKWLDEVQRQTGVKPMIYMSESVTYEDNWQPVVDGDYGLWVAKYSKNKPKVKYWPSYAMWQYTSTPYDKSYFYGDRKAWQAYAKKQGQPTPQEAPAKKDERTEMNAWGQVIDPGYELDTLPWGQEGFKVIKPNLDGHMGEYVHVTASDEGKNYYEITLQDGTSGWYDHRGLAILPSEPPQDEGLYRITRVK